MYLEIDEGYFEHPKTLDLCARLSDSKACVYPLRLWKWACRSAKNGKLGKISAFAMEKAMDYEPMDGRCFESMCAAGFVDRHEDGTFKIHDWMDYTGGALKRMEEKAAENKRRREEGKRRHEAEQASNRTGIVPVQSENQAGTNPTKTRQDQSSPDQTSKGDPPARDPGTTDTEPVVPPLAPDRPFLPDTPDRLVACIKAAVEKARPERGFWDPGAKGSFVHQDAAEFLRGLGDIDFVAHEVMRRIQLFAKDDRMAPWTFAKFRREYNGIGVERPPAFQAQPKKQANYG